MMQQNEERQVGLIDLGSVTTETKGDPLAPPIDTVGLGFDQVGISDD
ncbi:benenodin family lasso peptide [Sphingomonas koreensis]